MKYELIDSGDGKKLEVFGKVRLVRPCSAAVWKPILVEDEWEKADAIYTREKQNGWIYKKKIPAFWNIEVENLKVKVLPTDFGHLGIFPEQKKLWGWMRDLSSKKKPKILNLFAYSGIASLVLAKVGAKVTHLDASKGMVARARENAMLNGLGKTSIRWIVEDVMKFLKRELKRKNNYDAILLDPPSFGRGIKGEVFKIERDLLELLQMCKMLLSKNPLFFLISCHTPGFTPSTLKNLLQQTLQRKDGKYEAGEMFLESSKSFSIPSGSYARCVF